MIVFDLECRTGGHRFEGWFGSSEDFTSQQQRGLVSCPQCQSAEIFKAPMAPNLARKGNQIVATAAPKPQSMTSAVAVPQVEAPAAVPGAGPQASLPPEAAAMMQAFVRMQAEALKTSHWVGEKFADHARAIHYGEKDPALIHGHATPKEAHALLEEGIEIAPILFPVVPPGLVN